MQSARSRWSYGKIEDCEQSIPPEKFLPLHLYTWNDDPTGSQHALRSKTITHPGNTSVPADFKRDWFRPVSSELNKDIAILRSCESVVIPSFSISSHRFSSVDIEGKINIIRNQLYTWRQLSIVLDLEKMQQPTQAVSTTQGTQPVATFKVCFKPFASLQSYWFFLNRLPLFNVNCSYNSLFLLVTVVQGRQRLLNAIWQENSRKNMLVSTRRA